MSNMNEEIKNIVIEILEVESDQLSLETDFVKDLGIDSLRALEIMAVLEKKYKIKISEELLNKMTNLKQVIGIVEEKLTSK